MGDENIVKKMDNIKVEPYTMDDSAVLSSTTVKFDTLDNCLLSLSKEDINELYIPPKRLLELLRILIKDIIIKSTCEVSLLVEEFRNLGFTLNELSIIVDIRDEEILQEILYNMVTEENIVKSADIEEEA